MNYQKKTKEELISALESLQKDNDSIKNLLEECNKQQQLNKELTSTIEDLYNLQDRYNKLYNNTPAMLFTLDINFYLKNISEFWLNKLGYSREEVLGKNLKDFIPVSLHPVLEKDALPVLKKKGFIQNVEIQFIRKDGYVLDALLSCNAEYGKKNKIDSFLCVVTDITEKIEAEEALKESEFCYRTVVSSANDGIIYQERSGKILTWNKKAEEIFKLKAKDVLNRSGIHFNWEIYKEDESVFPPEEHPSIITLLTGKPCRDKVMKIVHPDQSYFWINMNTNPVFKEGSSSPEAVIITFSDITERKDSEKSIEEITQLNRQIIENVQEGIIVYDSDLRYVVWNPFMENLIGIPASEVIGKLPIEVFPFLDDIGIMDNLMKSLKEGLITEVETPYVIPSTQKSGWAADTNSPLRNTKGEIVGVIATIKDITSRKETELKLMQKNNELLTANKAAEESQEYNRLLFNTSPIGLALCKMSGELVDINPAYANIIGRTVEETLKLTYWDITPKTYLKQEFDQLNKLKESGKYGPYEKEYIHKDGHLVPVLLNGLIFRQKGEDFIWSTVEDITDRKKTEEALILSEQRYRLIAENTSDVIWVLDLDSKKFSYMSPSVKNLCGYTVNECLNLSFYDLFNKESIDSLIRSINVEIQKYLLKKKYNKTLIHEMQLRCKDGYYLWVEISTTLLRNEDNQINEIIGVTRNIEERKKVEFQIQKQNNELIEVNATKDKFFSLIAHDLKSPFSSILGLAEMLVDNIDSLNIDEIKELSQYIYISADKTYRLLENLLEWSRLQRGLIVPDFQYWNLKVIIDEIHSLMSEVAKNKGITISNNITKDLSIFCDNDMLRTVIRNLMSNAIKFTRNEGVVTMNAFQRGTHIEIQVIDNGIGIPQNMIPKLFKMEKNLSTPGTANEYGTGLGLMLCNDLIKKQGGTIWVESEEGKGTIFYFTIPNRSEEVKDLGISDNETKKESQLPKKSDHHDDKGLFRILVAEDEDINYQLAAKLLSGLKLYPIRARNGKEAIEIMESDDSIDLILMDIRMPIIDGYEATRSIKKTHPETPIIVQTAFAEESDQAKAFEAGCDDYMKKPLKKETLLALISKYLDLKS